MKKIKKFFRKLILKLFFGIDLDEYEQFVIQTKCLEELKRKDISFNEYIQKCFDDVILRGECDKQRRKYFSVL